MITIDGERYEYEMNVLLKLRDMKLGVVEVPIETIYIDDNSGSHFNPVRDAIRIYAVIFKYLFSSVTSFAVDYLLYWLCLGVFKLAPLLSYALARLVSSQVNYHLNKHTVFSGRGGKHSMVKYYALAVVQGPSGRGTGAVPADRSADFGGGGQDSGRSTALCGQLLHSARLCV